MLSFENNIMRSNLRSSLYMLKVNTLNFVPVLFFE